MKKLEWRDKWVWEMEDKMASVKYKDKAEEWRDSEWMKKYEEMAVMKMKIMTSVEQTVAHRTMKTDMKKKLE